MLEETKCSYSSNHIKIYDGSKIYLNDFSLYNVSPEYGSFVVGYNFGGYYKQFEIEVELEEPILSSQVPKIDFISMIYPEYRDMDTGDWEPTSFAPGTDETPLYVAQPQVYPYNSDTADLLLDKVIYENADGDPGQVLNPPFGEDTYLRTMFVGSKSNQLRSI